MGKKMAFTEFLSSRRTERYVRAMRWAEDVIDMSDFVTLFAFGPTRR